MNQYGILVVGSANIDLVAATQRFPRPGETVFGATFGMFPGGKGANQAVCCAKLGGRTYFLGKMGNDVFQEKLVQNMKKQGVRLQHLLVDHGTPTGVALITVDRTGQNKIVVISGSNMRLVPRDIDRQRGIFSSTKVTLLQLEIPLEAVIRSAQLAKKHGHQVILNPAPARRLPKRLLRLLDFLTPNETEAEILTGIRVRTLRAAEEAARKLLLSGVQNVIVTLGKKGCLLINKRGLKLFPARKVRAVDTTAAGDAFNGALAFSLARGRNLDSAIHFANGVAAYSVTRMGAQSSMPTMREIRRFI